MKYQEHYTTGQKLANVSNSLLQSLYYYKKMLLKKCTCQMLLYSTWAFKKNSCGYIMHYVIKRTKENVQYNGS